MFFILSKTVAFLFLPSNLLILLGLAGVALMATHRKRAGACMAAASLVLLATAGFYRGGLLIHALESRFPPRDASHSTPDGIVVLGGAIESELSEIR